MKMWIDGLTVVASGLAAVLWLCSARVQTPKSFSVEVVATVTLDPENLSGQGIGQGFGTSKDLTALGEALIRQSRLSSWAAGAAAVAAICQALSLKISN